MPTSLIASVSAAVALIPLMATTAWGQSPDTPQKTITDLPFNWTAKGIDLETLDAFTTWHECVEDELEVSATPDECLFIPAVSTHGKKFEPVFEILYWLQDIEPALWSELEKFKPEKLAPEERACFRSTKGNFCPPWRSSGAKQLNDRPIYSWQTAHDAGAAAVDATGTGASTPTGISGGAKSGQTRLHAELVQDAGSAAVPSFGRAPVWAIGLSVSCGLVCNALV